MNRKLLFILFSISIMCGCAVKANLYPVQGPLAAQPSAAVYTVKFTGLTSSNMSIVIADGEVCTGHWTYVEGGASADTPPDSAAPANSSAVGTSVTDGMPAAWDAVYGHGYYVANVLGRKLYAHAILTGNRGTILNVEFYRADGRKETPGYGVAKDNKGDIFKLAF